MAIKKRKKKRSSLSRALGEHKLSHEYEIIEKFVDKTIPIILILLAIIITLDNPLWQIYSLEAYEKQLSVFDLVVVILLVIDLYFKWTHIRKIKTFLRLYWLDIFAVFPFFLVFRTYIFVAEFVKAGEEAQRAFHEALLLRETKILREAKFFQEIERFYEEERLAVRAYRTGVRAFRLLVMQFELVYLNMLKRSRELRRGKWKGE